MAIPYDQRFNKKKASTKTYLCGVCSKEFNDLGTMLQHEDDCSGDYIPAEEDSKGNTTPKLNPPNAPFTPKLPYGYGQK